MRVIITRVYLQFRLGILLVVTCAKMAIYRLITVSLIIGLFWLFPFCYNDRTNFIPTKLLWLCSHYSLYCQPTTIYSLTIKAKTKSVIGIWSYCLHRFYTYLKRQTKIMLMYIILIVVSVCIGVIYFSWIIALVLAGWWRKKLRYVKSLFIWLFAMINIVQ